MRDLIPWGRNRSSVPSAMQSGGEIDPFFTLHREVNRLFDDMFRRFDTGLPSVFGGQGFGGAGWPSVEVSATDKEVRVSAELPGLDEKDVEVLVDDGVLTIRGEKKSETDDRDRGFSERFYGRFERRVALPFEVDEDKADASFKNGVLTIALPKSPKAEEKAKRIPIGGRNDTKH
jgi:HSP20 family protein